MDKADLPPADLKDPPRDPKAAHNYAELYALWKELNDKLETSPGLDKEAFHDWAHKVVTLLDNEENKRFLKPLRPTIPVDDGTIQYARAFHLTKILRARQGWEKLMSDTGY